MKDYTVEEKTKYYVRNSGTHRKNLKNNIERRYKSINTCILTSEMHAINITVMHVLEATDKKYFLYMDELYCDVLTKVIRNNIKKYPDIIFIKFKVDDLKNVLSQYKNNIVCIYLESCSNPTGNIVDFNLLKNIKNTEIIVDNTWLTSLVFNPFKFGATIVIESCAKYNSAGKCIAGFVTFNKKSDISINIRNYVYDMGIHISPIYCEHIIKCIKTLKDKISVSYKRTIECINELKEEKNIEIIHPSIKTHPSYGNIDFSVYGPSVFCIKIFKKLGYKEYKSVIEQACEKADIKYSTSFGKSYDLIDQWPKRKKQYIQLRISVGYKNYGSLSKKLIKVIDHINTNTTS